MTPPSDSAERRVGGQPADRRAEDLVYRHLQRARGGRRLDAEHLRAVAQIVAAELRAERTAK